MPSINQRLSIGLVDTRDENDIALDICRKVWSVMVPLPDDVLIELPADIEALRAADLALAQKLRRYLRAIVDGPLRNGWRLAGMTADYRYVLRPPKKESP